MSKLTNLEPTRVFHYFEELSAIPHGSRNMEAISSYCMNFAREHGLEAVQDETFNVVITKEASKGYEEAPTVILQGHLDMVCEKDLDSDFDFKTQGLDLQIDGDEIYAKGTTLGGDNAIAVAMAMAILEDTSLSHPRLECIFTVDEEIGLLGAGALDTSRLQGRRMINMDSEEEGVFTVGCAGGLRGDCILPLSFMEVEGVRCHISIEGLLGGHSGAEIHKEHGNSNILMGRLLCRLDETFEFALAEVHGGLMDNAIPRKTEAVIYVKEEDTAALEEELTAFGAILKNEFRASDKDVTVLFQNEGVQTGKAMTPNCASRLLLLLHIAPNGVMKNSMEIEGLVQTSLNLGVLKMNEEEVSVGFSVRSSVESEKWELSARLQHCTEFLGGTYEVSGDYPGWEYKADSVLRDTMVRVYERVYGKKAEVVAIHAGLECGIFSGKLEGLDCVSIGPNMKDIHTPQERLSISSARRVYEFVLEVLKELK